MFFGGARNRYDKGLLRQFPRQHDVRGGGGFGGGESSCSKSNTDWFFVITSAEKGFIVRRKSPLAYWVCALKRPLKKPFPSGLYATKPIWLASQKANNAFSGARNTMEYWFSVAVIGVTAWAAAIYSIGVLDTPQ